MTEQERIEFIKDKLAPLFDGMNAGDIIEILHKAAMTPALVLSRFTLSPKIV